MSGSEIALRALRAATSAILRRVGAGERLVVTVDRRPVAALVPLERRRERVPALEGWDRIGAAAADPGLRAELDRVLPDQIQDL